MLCLISKPEFGNTKQQKTSYEDVEVCEGEVQKKPIILCWIQKIHGWPDHKRLSKNGSSKTTWDTWFISHHWVYHPSKPGKIRAVFDSSVDFDEQSLNKELVTGPDLTNQIVGVITRFWKNSVTFMADRGYVLSDDGFWH